jgi:hypothetical protein
MTVMFGINALGRHKYHHARDEHSKELCRNIYIASQSQNLGDEENCNVYNNDQNQDLWRPTIQLHTPLLEICHHALPRRTANFFANVAFLALFPINKCAGFNSGSSSSSVLAL